MHDGRLFMLQVWPAPDRFRAVLRAVDETEAVRFDAVQPLCAYLAALAGPCPVLAQAVDAHREPEPPGSGVGLGRRPEGVG